MRSGVIARVAVTMLIACVVTLASIGVAGAQALPPTVGIASPSGAGYWAVGSDGGVFTFGDASFHGSLGGQPLNKPVVGMAATPDGDGYWLVASDGGVFAFGNAQFHGSMSGLPLNAAIVGIAPTVDGKGYWLVGGDGGVFAFGNAPFHGSMAGQPLNAPIVGMASSAGGLGYWLVGRDGGIFAFGNAPFRGSMGGLALNAPIVGMASTADGQGYWLVGADGGIFTFGSAPFLGSRAGQALNAPVVGMAATPNDGGYWLIARDGGVFAYGNAPFQGTPIAPPPPPPIGVPPPPAPPPPGPVTLPPATSPVAGKSITVARVVGRVTVTLPGSGQALVLDDRATIPDTSEIDTKRGRVTLTQALGNSKVQRAEARLGRFLVRLSKTRGTLLRLSEPLTACARGRRTFASKAKKTRKRKLWLKDRDGSWRTEGKHAAATAKGTRWTIADTCTSTTVTVLEGTVVVRPLDGRPSFDLRAPNRRIVRSR